MAIKVRETACIEVESGNVQNKAPITLTAVEYAALSSSLAMPSKPLSSEVKQAIANYKKINALRVR
ncbi:MAG: hypothetical protein NT023_08650 [Armatimonadetes bacterium]|nr:hypothetical protein [Armatimonadota bacterium]